MNLLKQYSTFCLLLLLFIRCNNMKNNLSWDNLLVFKVCTTELPNTNFSTISTKDIDSLSFIYVNINEAKDVLKKSKAIDKSYLWKGAILGIMRFSDGKEYKVKISNYGAFFEIIELKQKFEIRENEASNTWYKIISQN